MFKVDSSNEIVQIQYTIQNKIGSVEIHELNEKKRYEQFCILAFDFLKFSLDQLNIEIQKIKPHFFNNTLVPYLNDQSFCRYYWQFISMREKSQKELLNMYSFVSICLCYDLNGLVPLYNFENRELIKELVTDITSVTKNLSATLNKLNNDTTISIC